MNKGSKVFESDEHEESNDSDYGDDMLEMVEADDLEFIKNAITSKSYNILNRVKYSGSTGPKSKKRKLNNGKLDGLESEYEDKMVHELPMKSLLPIKTKQGVVRQQIVDESGKDLFADDEEQQLSGEESTEKEDDGEKFTYIESGIDLSKPISAMQLLMARNEVLNQKKLHIGTLSSGVLENPEDKITNLRTLLKLMDDEAPEVFYTVRKLATVSLLEIFKDLLPSYEIKNTISEGVKVKKDTLKLQKYEATLLQYYKKYLKKLEQNCSVLIKKKGDSRKLEEEKIKLGELAVKAMSELLVTHPYFNYAQNIAQAVVPFLNSSRQAVREVVKSAVRTVFTEDKKEEITLKILRVINNYLKNHAHNVNTDMLEVLLVLNLKDVNLDQEKEHDMKQKKLLSHKANLLQQSKKERKRKKKLQLLEKELLETKAEENKQTRLQNLTEITKMVFGIYFRILKSSNNTKVLGISLEGLAKFSHCINMDFYIDLVNLLDKLLKEDWIGYREQLHCIQTVFSILSGQGEALNVDPTRFYNSLYKDLLTTHAAQPHNNFPILLRTLNDALIKRRKKITNKRTIGFSKRLATFSLQLEHNGALSSLSLVKTAMQLNRSLDILLDLDSSVGDGKFHSDIDDPEYANATSTALYEVILLNKHYHPIVCKYSKNIAYGVPATGEGSLPSEYGKCTSDQLYRDYDMSEMGFNPPVPVPKQVTSSVKVQRHQFADGSLEKYCKVTLKEHMKTRGTLLF